MLKRGDRGPAVTRLKELLRGGGIQVADSDLFDLGTEAAIMEIQSLGNIDIDGIYGPQTARQFGSTKFFNEDINPIGWIAYDTPYFSQRDNLHVPGGTCNVTSLAMVLAKWGFTAGDKQLEDHLYEMLQSKAALTYFNKNFPSLKRNYKPRNVHGMLVYLAKKFQMNARFVDNASWKEMETFGSNYGPMILSGSMTNSGHVVTLVGMTRVSKHLIVHDPYGDWTTSYQNQDGQFRIYPRPQMESVLKGRGRGQYRCHFIKPRDKVKIAGLS